MSEVVIVGGGFGGITVARELERLLPKRDVRITLVSAESSMLYTPLLSLVAAGVLDARHAMVPLTPQLSRTTLVLGSARAVDLPGRRLEVLARTGETRSLRWDQLVLAPGSVTRLPEGADGVGQLAFGVKTLNEVAAVRSHVLEQLELAHATQDPRERRRRTTFVVVGAGYAGTEMTAELQSTAQKALRHYPTLQDAGTRWLLLQHGARILPELDESLSVRAADVLRDRGVEIRTGTSVEDADATRVRLTTGERVETSTLIWSAGVAPHPWVADLGLPADDRGRLMVTPHLQVQDHPDVYAIGDAAAVTDEDGTPAPPTASQAAAQGRTCARNIAATLCAGVGQDHEVRKDRTLVVNLADRTGVGEVAGVPVAGAVGWTVALVDRVAHLPAGHRLRVALGWTLGDGGAPDVAELGQIGSHDPHAAAEPTQATYRELQAARDR
jgi:NADH dehydrogenase